MDGSNGLTKISKTVSAINSKPIKDCGQEILGVIYRIGLLTGISNQPKKDETKEIVNFCKREYGKFGILELEHAFQLYASGKIEVEHYNKLSPLFIGKVMKKYDEIRRDEIHKQKKLKEQQERMNQQKITITQEDEEKEFNRILKGVKNTGSIPLGSRLTFAWSYAKRTGLIKATNKELQEFKNEIIDALKHERFGRNSHRANLILGNEQAIRFHCQCEYMKKYFEQ